MSDLDLGPIERRAQERIDIVAEHGGLIPLVEEDRVRLLAEVRALRERVATLERERSEVAQLSHRYRNEWVAERERRTELERGIRETLKGPVSTNAREMLVALLDASHPSVAEMAGSFEGGPDSVEWLREQRGDDTEANQ